MEPRLDILPQSQRSLWPRLGLIPQKFVLYGGTAIALRFGHRESVDFDFFSSLPFDGDEILNLPLFKDSNLLSRTPGSITITVDSPTPVKFQFFGDLPSLPQSDRQIMENAVADFWSSKLEPPATAADSTNLSSEK